MKLFPCNNLYLSPWVVVVIFLCHGAVVVTAHDGSDDSAPTDCDAICQAQLQPFIAEQATFQQEQEALRHQLEAVTKQRDTIQDELRHIQAELERAHAATNEARTLLATAQEEVQGQYAQELEALQQSITLTKEEMTHYQKVAQDNQKYMQEYKNQLHSQRDKANKINEALKEANLKIQELESTTFLKQLQKEIRMAWAAIQVYWTNLTNKGKTEADAEF